MRTFRDSAVFVFVAWVACFASRAQAQEPTAADPNEQAVLVRSSRTNVELIEKFVKVIELQKKIKKVDGFDPTVVNVVALSAKRIRVQALTQGVTTLVLSDEDDNTYLVDLFIKGDARHLQAILNAKFPDAAVEAFKVREAVVLRGWVTQPDQITQIVEIAEQFYPQVLNQMQVGGEQQIFLRVKIMEVQRSKIRRMGMNLLYLNRNSYFSSTPGSLVSLSETALPFAGGPTVEFDAGTLRNASLSFAIMNEHNIFNAFLDALKEESLLKILARPELHATNGRPSSLLSGGEFPVVVPQSLGTSTIEWKEFGVRLETVPTVLGNGRLRLELQTEVSERDFTNAVELDGLTVPGLTTRRANTAVEMHFGETMLIAGLISNRRTSNSDKVPLLGELPVIGAAFRNIRYDDVETELIIMVTPEMTAALDPGQVLPGGPGLGTTTPTDRELFFGGQPEVPNYEGNAGLPGAIVPAMQPPVRDVQQAPVEIKHVPPNPAPATSKIPAPSVSSANNGFRGAPQTRPAGGIFDNRRSFDQPQRKGRESLRTGAQGNGSIRQATFQTREFGGRGKALPMLRNSLIEPQ